MSNLSVFIGIPAFNEAANIDRLLNDVMKQQQKEFSIDTIAVVSDGSTDNTALIAKQIHSELIKVIEHASRRGKSSCLDEMMKMSNADVFITLDADTAIFDDTFLSTLITPIVRDNADLVSARVKPLAPRGLIQHLLWLSMKFKTDFFEHYRSGNNIYTCHGRALAFSKRFYKSIQFGNTIDDAYAYHSCVRNRFVYRYAKSAVIRFNLPASLSDHRKQSVRFFQSQAHLYSKFDESFVRTTYHLPFWPLVASAFKFILIHPLIVVYYMLALALKAEALFKKNLSAPWPIARSSKMLGDT